MGYSNESPDLPSAPPAASSTRAVVAGTSILNPGCTARAGWLPQLKSNGRYPVFSIPGFDRQRRGVALHRDGPRPPRRRDGGLALEDEPGPGGGGLLKTGGQRQVPDLPQVRQLVSPPVLARRSGGKGVVPATRVVVVDVGLERP